MEDLDHILARLVDAVDGARAAAISGMDGLLVEQYPRQGEDLSLLAAEQTNILASVSAAYGLQGDAAEVIVTSARLTGYTRLLNRELFLLLLLEAEGNLGKARLYSAQLSPQILEVLQ